MFKRLIYRTLAIHAYNFLLVIILAIIGNKEVNLIWLVMYEKYQKLSPKTPRIWVVYVGNLIFWLTSLIQMNIQCSKKNSDLRYIDYVSIWVFLLEIFHDLFNLCTSLFFILRMTGAKKWQKRVAYEAYQMVKQHLFLVWKKLTRNTSAYIITTISK